MIKTIALSFMLSYTGVAFSQLNDSIPFSSNYSYLEFGGRYYLGGGIIYERRIPTGKSFSLYLGTGLGSSAATSGDKNWPLIVPVSAGFFWERTKGTFKLGLSRIIVDEDFYDSDESYVSIYPYTLNFSYRKLSKDLKNVFFKVDFVLYPVDLIGVFPSLGLGVGYKF